jgi:hypothetical protein
MIPLRTSKGLGAGSGGAKMVLGRGFCSSPFKGEVGMGMGLRLFDWAGANTIPTQTSPLKGRTSVARAPLEGGFSGSARF